MTFVNAVYSERANHINNRGRVMSDAAYSRIFGLAFTAVLVLGLVMVAITELP